MGITNMRCLFITVIIHIINFFIVQVERIFVHENFDFMTVDNDVALLKLTDPINLEVR